MGIKRDLVVFSLLRFFLGSSSLTHGLSNPSADGCHFFMASFFTATFFSSLAFSALLPECFPSRKPASLFARILFLLRNWGRRGKLGALQLCSCLFIMPYKRTGTSQQGLIPFETQIPILGGQSGYGTEKVNESTARPVV